MSRKMLNVMGYLFHLTLLITLFCLAAFFSIKYSDRSDDSVLWIFIALLTACLVLVLRGIRRRETIRSLSSHATQKMKRKLYKKMHLITTRGKIAVCIMGFLLAWFVW